MDGCLVAVLLTLCVVLVVAIWGFESWTDVYESR